MVPDGLRCALTHEWCILERNSKRTIVVIGVTKHALTGLGNVIYVDLFGPGSDVLADIPFGEIEGVDNTKSLKSHFDGEIVSVNNNVVHNPAILVEDPYVEGWLVRLVVEGIPCMDDLLSASEYERAVKRRRR